MGGGGSPRYSAITNFSGSTGGRQMPGESRSPLHGARDKASLTRANFAGNIVSTNTNMFTVAWQNSVNRRLGDPGIFQTAGLASGVGGGPNERGTSGGAWETYGNSVFGVNEVAVTTSAEGQIQVNTNWAHKLTGGTFVNNNARHVQYNYPYWFLEDLSNASSYEPRNTNHAGGGGWGASGGDHYTFVDISTVTISYGGAGGPAVKTNGNAVTWVGGQGTDRVFGAIS